MLLTGYNYNNLGTSEMTKFCEHFTENGSIKDINKLDSLFNQLIRTSPPNKKTVLWWAVLSRPNRIIAVITSRVHTKAKLPTHTAIKDFEGLSKDSIILLE